MLKSCRPNSVVFAFLTTVWFAGRMVFGCHDGIHDRNENLSHQHALSRDFFSDRDLAWIRRVESGKTENQRNIRKQEGGAAKKQIEPRGEFEQNHPVLESKVPLSGPSEKAFQAYSDLTTVRIEDNYLFVESVGMPNHRMMIGIRSWQQQVPLPQEFHGENAWRLPMKPRYASQPISVLKEPLRGAIGLAVNGVPIFCALNNRAEDTYLAGELDEWGGHCGRGDDYHYHIAPDHLEKKVGIGNPIAFALDGYPILGFTEADGSKPKDLDAFNGHEDADGNYHYHATKNFPYVNGGLRGVVNIRGGEIQQPKGSPIRPAFSPLRGAVITGFEREENKFEIEYKIEGETGQVEYTILDEGGVEFVYSPPNRDSSKVVYRKGKPILEFARSIVFWISVSVGTIVAAVLLRRRWRNNKKTPAKAKL